MQKITRIGPLSLGKLMGGIGLVFGLFFGVIFTLVSFLGASASMFDGGSAADGIFGLLFGVGALFVLPLLYGGFAFIQGLLTALVANLAMRFFGGLEVRIEG